MFLRYLLYVLLIYLLYRLIFHFIIPVYRTSGQLKKQFRDMQSRMQEEMNQASYNTSASEKQPDNNTKTTSSKGQEGDYIDFEEVK